MAAFVAEPQATRGWLSDLPNSIKLVPSGIYTATASAEFQVDAPASSIEVVYDQTAGTAAQSVTVSIEAFNVASGAWDTLLTAAAGTSATTDSKSLLIGANVNAVANVAAARAVRRRMRVTVTHADAKNVTYSLAVVANVS